MVSDPLDVLRSRASIRRRRSRVDLYQGIRMLILNAFYRNHMPNIFVQRAADSESFDYVEARVGVLLYNHIVERKF